MYSYTTSRGLKQSCEHAERHCTFVVCPERQVPSFILVVRPSCLPTCLVEVIFAVKQTRRMGYQGAVSNSEVACESFFKYTLGYLLCVHDIVILIHQ